MMGSIKALTRNNEESKGIFIGPSMAPHFLLITRTPFVVAFMNLHSQGCRLQAQILRHGWQADLQRLLTTRGTVATRIQIAIAIQGRQE